MPVDGFTVLQTIRKEKLGNDPTVVILSNQGQDSDIARAKELGAHGYVVKASTIPSEVLVKVLEAIRVHKGSVAASTVKS
jgi:DNA-binding response OmpR family regulator